MTRALSRSLDSTAAAANVASYAAWSTAVAKCVQSRDGNDLLYATGNALQ